MFAFRRILNLLSILTVLALLFSLPLRQAAANVLMQSAGSLQNQLLVAVKPDTSGRNTPTAKVTDKVHEMTNKPEKETNNKPDRFEKTTDNLNNTATVQGNVYNLTDGVSFTDLGMVPDDETKALYNYKILLAEVKKGTKIKVNGTYYLESPYNACSSENEINAGLFLIGDSPANSKLILKGGSFFNIKGSALLENIFIECPTNRVSYLIRMTAPFVNDTTIRNNYIIGNIKVVDSNIPLDFDFASELCFVEKIIIENNEFHDVHNEGSYIFDLDDTPVKLSYIRNNKVTNFSYVFYKNSITNNHPFADYLIENTNAIIENNKVICTDDYDAVAENSGHIAMYYCFALINGFTVKCSNNVFEGFHLSDAPGKYVYDNYFSVTKLLYEGNTWKNNVNFTPNISSVDIMKSKYAPLIFGENTERIYKNNTYIVEPSYADRFGKDRFLLRKEINTWVTDINSIIIEDNYFDLYMLSFRGGGQKFKELYKFNRNTILTDTFEQSITWQAFAYNYDMKDESGDFIPRNLIFTNNTITCENEPFGQGIGTHGFYLIFNTAGSGDKTTVDFANNLLDIPDFKFNLSEITASSNCNTNINFINNIINGTNPQSNSAEILSNEV